MGRFLLLGLVLALLAPAASAHDLTSAWPLYRGTPERLAAVANAGPAGPEVAWTDTHEVSTNFVDEVGSGPIIHNGRLYVGLRSSDPVEGRLYAYDLAGNAGQPSVLWSKRLGNAVRGPPVADADVVYAVGNDAKGHAYALSAADGATRWTVDTPNHIVNGPVLADGVLYFADNSGTVYALDAATGNQRWKSNALGIPNANSIAVWGEHLFLATYSSPTGCNQPCSDDLVYALRRDNGVVAWVVDPTEPWTTDEDLSSSPAVVGGRVFVTTPAIRAFEHQHGGGSTHQHAAIDGKLYSLDAATGATRWAQPLGIYSFYDAAVLDGVLYAAANDGSLHAYDAATGERRWSLPLNDNLKSAAVIADGHAYVLSVNMVTCTDPTSGTEYPCEGSERWLHAVDLVAHQESWALPVMGSPVGAPIVAQGYAATLTYDAGFDQALVTVVGSNGGVHPPNVAPMVELQEPANAAEVPSSGARIRWGGADPDGDALQFDVYLGLVNPPPLFRNLMEGQELDTGPLAPTRTYYWRVVVHDAHGATAASPIQSFSVDDTLTSDASDGGNGGKGSPGPGVAVFLMALAWVLARRRN